MNSGFHLVARCYFLVKEVTEQEQTEQNKTLNITLTVNICVSVTLNQFSAAAATVVYWCVNHEQSNHLCLFKLLKQHLAAICGQITLLYTSCKVMLVSNSTPQFSTLETPVL